MSESEKKPESNKLFYRMQPEDVDLTTDIRTSILAQTPKGGRAILWVVMALLVLFMVWAYYSEIEQVTRGDGKVVPSTQIQVIQNLEGGILSEIMIDVGQLVKKDQLLLRIDETRFSSSFKQNRVKYLASKSKAARLEAESNGSNFEVPQEVINEKPQIGVREKELFESRRREFNSSMQRIREQISQRKHEYRELTSKLEELTRTFALLNKELELTRPLVAQGAVSEVEVLHLERQASMMQGEIATIKQSIPKSDSKLQEAQMELRENQLAFFNKAKSELNDVLAELEDVSASAIAIEDRLRRTNVQSPVTGTINRLLVNTVGGVIQPGMDLVEIVPLEDTLVIETNIKPADIAFLRPDQDAKVKFTAYDFTIYGGLEAKLEHISADSITDDKGNSFYLVRLRTSKNYLGPETNPLPIIPGMVASVDILTGKKTILSYLLKPVLRAKYMALREQ
ncbi:MAG: HlyD family type I secretion periplasmic adaptor subunit [Desulfobacterales bacterium]|nr:HlyD family type I secretion periplasmic adaptor subunit [Desulfobacterales bacterium]